MSNRFNEELISAYLDGELTAEELASVEQKLSESPEHQQMLGELSALRDSFQALPTYKLDRRFGERVLRAAERNMLAESSLHNSIATASSAGDELPTPASVRADNRKGLRVAVGCVAAVAALILITLFLAELGNNDEHRHVASHEESSPSDDKTVAKKGMLVEHLPASRAKVKENDRNDKHDSNNGSGTTTANEAISGIGDEGFSETSEDAAKPSSTRRQGLDKQARVNVPGQRKAGSGTVSELGKSDGFGGIANEHETERQLRARGGGSLPTADSAEEETLFENSEFRADNYDFVVVVEVPKEQYVAQPVEVALRNKNVKEQEDSGIARGLNRANSGISLNAAAGSRTPAAVAEAEKKPVELQTNDSEAAASVRVLRDELLVVATREEIDAVCEALENQGLRTTRLGENLSRSGPEALSDPRRKRVSAHLLTGEKDAGGEAGKIAESLNSEHPKGERDPARDTRKLSASVSAPPKPSPAVPGNRPTINKSADAPQSGAIAPSDAPASSMVRRAKVRRDQSDEAKADDKLELADADGRSGSQNVGGQLSRQLVETRDAQKTDTSFYRRIGRDDTAGEVDQPGRQPVAANSGEKQQQRLANAAAYRVAESPGDVADEQAAPSPRLQVRFIIRPVESFSSGTAAEEPAPER